jgi:Double zinc ribbon
MGAFAVFGIQNDGLNVAVNLLLLSLVVLWLALVYWTYADARRRIEDPMLVGCAAAAAMFPFIGTIVYMIVRPPEFLEDRHERELEIAAAEARLASMEGSSCPYCGFDIERSFLRCPSCLRRLKEPCGVCGKPLDPRWKICPYCEAEVGHSAPEPRRRGERPLRASSSASGKQPTVERSARTTRPPG